MDTQTLFLEFLEANKASRAYMNEGYEPTQTFNEIMMHRLNSADYLLLKNRTDALHAQMNQRGFVVYTTQEGKGKNKQTIWNYISVANAKICLQNAVKLAVDKKENGLRYYKQLFGEEIYVWINALRQVGEIYDFDTLIKQEIKARKLAKGKPEHIKRITF